MTAIAELDAAISLAAKGDRDGAIARTVAVLATHLDVMTLHHAGVTLAVGHERQAAMALFRLALDRDPGFPWSRMELANQLFDANRPAEGMVELQRVSLGHNAPPTVFVRLARMLAGQGKTVEARAMLRAALVAEPENADWQAEFAALG